MGRRDSTAGRTAVIWLATTVVLLLGAAGTAFVILISVKQDVEYPLMVWAGIFTAIILAFIIWNIRWDQPVNYLKFYLSFQKSTDPADAYDAARRSSMLREEYGTNEPPTIESVRDAAEHGGAWVPRSNSERRRPKR